MQLCSQQMWQCCFSSFFFLFSFFEVTPCLNIFDLETLLLHEANGAKSSDTSLKKSLSMYKKQYQTIVELNIVRWGVPSCGFTAPILILLDKGQREKPFGCGRCLMLWYIFRGRA